MSADERAQARTKDGVGFWVAYWIATLVVLAVFWVFISPEVVFLYLAYEAVRALYRLLRRKRKRPKSPPRKGTWLNLAAFILIMVLVVTGHVTAAAVVCAVDAFLHLQRVHYVDVGRFTFIVWPTRLRSEDWNWLLGATWVHLPDESKKAGFAVIVLRVGLGAYALMSRAEWAARKSELAAAKAKKADL